MSQNISINTRLRENTQSLYGTNQKEEQLKKGKSNTIFAGDLTMKADKVEMKKNMAQKQALKRILDQFTSDSQIDQVLSSQKENIDQLSDKIIQENKELSNLDAKQEEIQQMHQVEEGSQEQKDLELLRKQRDIMSGKSGDVLTKEEQERLNTMGEMTDYQKDSLENDMLIERSQKNIENAQETIQNHRKSITDIKIEVSKTHLMVEEQINADKIIKNASQEIIGMLKEEAIDHIDEVHEEEKEKAEEIQEKQEEIQETNKEEVMSDELNKVVESSQTDDPLKKELKKFMEESSMTLEELKGIVVDKTL